MVAPVTVKEAAVTVPLVAGKVTPPVAVRTPAVLNITVPPVCACTETLPKFMSTILVILMAVRMVAVAEAFATAWADTPCETDISITDANSDP
jgi:hypothetical protein